MKMLVILLCSLWIILYWELFLIFCLFLVWYAVNEKPRWGNAGWARCMVSPALLFSLFVAHSKNLIINNWADRNMQFTSTNYTVLLVCRHNTDVLQQSPTAERWRWKAETAEEKKLNFSNCPQCPGVSRARVLSLKFHKVPLFGCQKKTVVCPPLPHKNSSHWGREQQPLVMSRSPW